MVSRREFLKISLGAGMWLVSPWKGTAFPELSLPKTFPPPMLDPMSIAKYSEQLVVPPAMPRTSEITLPDGRVADYYEIAVRQFQQNILPSGMSLPTTVWGYGAASQSSTFNYPAYTIEATYNKPVRVKWINGLVDGSNNFLPHLLPVDQTIHWANPPGPRDTKGTLQTSYVGPVPMVPHLHGGHSGEESDGYPEAWYLPNANNIPSGYARSGSFYARFQAQFRAAWGVDWDAGTSIFQYSNNQRATTLWFHDHTLGMTRVNVYAGPAGFYIVRGGPDDLASGVLPGPAPAAGADPFGTYFEIPIVIQDRSFKPNGALFYPDNRAFFEGKDPSQLQIHFEPDQACGGKSDVAPIWNPEFFGNTIVVNGRTWPKLSVQKRRYRFRLLNGCNTRFLCLKIVSDATVRPGTAVLPFSIIGTEGGFLPAPVQVNLLLMGPAERMDVIVDFTNVPAGNSLYLINLGPDEPFGGGTAPADFDFADPNTTGQVMRFDVVAIQGTDTTTPPASLTLPTIVPLGNANRTRKVSLNEAESETVKVITDGSGNIVEACDNPSAEPFGPTMAMLGTVNGSTPIPKMWDSQITETPLEGDTEIWEIHNFTADAHPIHVHQVMFQIIDRQPFGGSASGPEAWESGWKDTVITYPGAITRIKAKFDLAGRYVWHCHILEHEDNEMMRPYLVFHRINLPWVTK